MNSLTEDTTPALSPRLESVDLLRGLVMVVMTLDHVRDFFYDPLTDPEDLGRTTTALFLTRWVTHFCAPAFIFLAGTAAYLSATRGRTRAQVSRFLLTRGLWLVFLELTLVRFGWYFNLDYRYTAAKVIWALGWSMVVLSALVYLPALAIGGFGILMIAGHNLVDHVHFQAAGWQRALWSVLHTGEPIELLPGVQFGVSYPLIPWIGVMAAGYSFGALLQGDRGPRRRLLIGLGAAMTLAFVALRGANRYGDPHPWSSQGSVLFTLLSFVRCEKYPPSLLYLLMTLGPLIAALGALDRDLGPIGRPLLVLGRVPLFYYLLHLPLIHALAVGYALAQYGRADWLFRGPPFAGLPAGYGHSVPVVYLVWAGVVLILYPACRWFAVIKARHRRGWLSYL